MLLKARFCRCSTITEDCSSGTQSLKQSLILYSGLLKISFSIASECWDLWLFICRSAHLSRFWWQASSQCRRPIRRLGAKAAPAIVLARPRSRARLRRSHPGSEGSSGMVPESTRVRTAVCIRPLLPAEVAASPRTIQYGDTLTHSYQTGSAAVISCYSTWAYSQFYIIRGRLFDFEAGGTSRTLKF